MIAEAGSELAGDVGDPHPRDLEQPRLPRGSRSTRGRTTRRPATAAAHARALKDFESLHGELSLIGIDMPLAREAGELAERFALRG